MFHADVMTSPHCVYSQMILLVVWKASSTMPSSWSDAARWKTLKMFFQPDLMFAAWELTICAMQRTTMSRIVGDLRAATTYTSVLIRHAARLAHVHCTGIHDCVIGTNAESLSSQYVLYEKDAAFWCLVAYNRLENLLHAPVLFHDVLERSQEVFLEAEVGELALLDELHRQLSQRVDGEERDVLVRVTANLSHNVTH